MATKIRDNSKERGKKKILCHKCFRDHKNSKDPKDSKEDLRDARGSPGRCPEVLRALDVDANDVRCNAGASSPSNAT